MNGLSVQVTLIVSERVECASAESFAEELRLKYKLIVAPVAGRDVHVPRLLS